MELFSLALTVGSYLFFQKLKDKTQSTWINPLLLSALSIIVILSVTQISYEKYNQGVSFITSLLGPATVALAIPLYENKAAIRKYSKTIFTSISVGVLVHTITILVLYKLLNFDIQMLVTVLPKSVTTAIAKDIAFQNGGLVEITIALVIITGIYGALIADVVFKLLNIKSSSAKGLALGVSAHAVGTSKAVEMGEIEASMSTIALILTGILTVAITPIILSIII